MCEFFLPRNDTSFDSANQEFCQVQRLIQFLVCTVRATKWIEYVL